MGTYAWDRKFTNYIHENLAIPIIYQPLEWKKLPIHKYCLDEIDLVHGIDYVFKDVNGNIKTVQERFRDSKYQHYSDFTIRFKREKNIDATRILSEYFKIKAHYFTYGITNGYKKNLSSSTDFLKFVILDYGSSTFIAIQIKDLAKQWEKEIVIVQKGFL